MPTKSTSLPRLLALAATGPLWALTTSGLAQTANTPPPADLNRASSPLLGFGLMFLLTAIVVAISLMPSKRSHQD